jgi:transcriptional regulator with XRE-family HTH domain
MAQAKRKNTTKNSFDYRGFGHRLRVTRIMLGLSEEEAAAAAGRMVDTWRKYEATGKGYCTGPLILFSEQYDINLDWLICGDAATIRRHHATSAQGKIAILPVPSALGRAVQS